VESTRFLYLASVWLHLVAALLWAGGMLFLVLVIVPLLRTPALRGQAIQLLQAVGLRFRTVGWASLLVLVVTGLVNAAYRGGSAGALADGAWWATPFGRLLAHKLGLVALILVLSAVHDFGVGPRAAALLRDDPASPRAGAWRAAASWMGRVNLLLALAVIAIAVALVRGGF
jgi:putative copper resistance protein D